MNKNKRVTEKREAYERVDNINVLNTLKDFERYGILDNFMAYNAEIDKVMAEQNIDEEEAMNIVHTYWEFPDLNVED